MHRAFVCDLGAIGASLSLLVSVLAMGFIAGPANAQVAPDWSHGPVPLTGEPEVRGRMMIGAGCLNSLCTDHLAPVVASSAGALPFANCHAEGTDLSRDDVASLFPDLDPRFWLGSQTWNNSAYGQPVSLTWSVVPDGTATIFGSAIPSTLVAALDAQFAALGGREIWIGLLEQSFDRWAELTGVSFTRLTFNGTDFDDGTEMSRENTGTATRGDIRIAGALRDGPGRIFASAFLPTYGDMALDIEENWADPASNFRFFRNVVMHEIGHSLGLNHVCSADRDFVMEPAVPFTIDGVQHDDLRGIQFQYGDASEPNDSAVTATDLGQAPPGTYLPLGRVTDGLIEDPTSSLSLHSQGDQDWFRLDAPTAARIVVSAVPVGLESYDDSSEGFCGTRVTDSTRQLTLTLEGYDSDGLALLDANAAALGNAATLTLDVPAGVVNLRVLAGGGNGLIQMYELLVSSFDPPPCVADLTTTGATLPGAPGFGMPDGTADLDDLGYFLNAWLEGDFTIADLTTTGATLEGPPEFGQPDGAVDLDDLGYFLNFWLAGCP